MGQRESMTLQSVMAMAECGTRGWDNVDRTSGEQVFFPADHHLQFAFDDMGDLFVDMRMFGQNAVFFYVPEHEGAAFAMDRFPEKAR